MLSVFSFKWKNLACQILRPTSRWIQSIQKYNVARIKQRRPGYGTRPWHDPHLATHLGRLGEVAPKWLQNFSKCGEGQKCSTANFSDLGQHDVLSLQSLCCAFNKKRSFRILTTTQNSLSAIYQKTKNIWLSATVGDAVVAAAAVEEDLLAEAAVVVAEV